MANISRWPHYHYVLVNTFAPLIIYLSIDGPLC